MAPRMSSNEVQRPRDKHFTTILLAAQEEFATHGLKGARMQAIADRAGLPKANVHYYFKNKVSLYLAVLNNIIATWDDVFNDARVHGVYDSVHERDSVRFIGRREQANELPV